MHTDKNLLLLAMGAADDGKDFPSLPASQFEAQHARETWLYNML